MKKFKNNTQNETIKLSNVPIDSSLGLLAIGDIAFTAWRKKLIKRKKTKELDEKK